MTLQTPHCILQHTLSPHLLVSVVLLLLQAWWGSCHPQCLDYKPPFEPRQPLVFCKEYSKFGCCDLEKDEEISAKFYSIMENFDHSGFATCGKYIRSILCQVRETLSIWSSFYHLKIALYIYMQSTLNFSLCDVQMLWILTCILQSVLRPKYGVNALCSGVCKMDTVYIFWACLSKFRALRVFMRLVYLSGNNNVIYSELPDWDLLEIQVSVSLQRRLWFGLSWVQNQ